MLHLLAVGFLLLLVAWALRELQLYRERAALTQAVDNLRTALENTRQHVRRQSEDLYVLASVLTERNIVDDTELARSRARLIEQPRRVAEEREALTKVLNVPATQLVVEDGDPKIH